MTEPKSASGMLPVVAVDVGNSRIKFGLFEHPAAPAALPHPQRTLTLKTENWEPVEIAIWLAPLGPCDLSWQVASVNRPTAERIENWIASEGASDRWVRLRHSELPLSLDVEQPEAVGMDRLVAAVAANRIRPPERPAIVVDLGTAITVDVVSSEGSFRGGAILPGVALSARALHEYTDLLPELEMQTLEEPPRALGTSTRGALASGIYWGAVGAMKMLIDQLSRDLDAEPFVVLSGGAAAHVAQLVGPTVCYEPHLVLAGIVLASLRP